MEAAIKDLGTRVQQLETENQLEENLVYRLNRDLLAAQSELNATLYRQRELTGKVDQILRKQSTRRYRGWGGGTMSLRKFRVSRSLRPFCG